MTKIGIVIKILFRDLIALNGLYNLPTTLKMIIMAGTNIQIAIKSTRVNGLLMY